MANPALDHAELFLFGSSLFGGYRCFKSRTRGELRDGRGSNLERCASLRILASARCALG